MKLSKVKRIMVGVIATTIICGLITGCGNSGNKSESGQNNSPAEKVTVQLNSSQSADSVAGQCAMRIKELAESELGTDRIEVEFFSDGQLGTDPTILEGMVLGTYDALIVGTPVTNVDSKFGLFDLPYLMSNGEDVKALIYGSVGETLTNSIGEKGYVNAGYLFAGFRQITNNVRPIVEPEDLKGVKIRVASSPSKEKMFKLMGANPTPMGFSELFSAMQQGVVDGQENPLYVLTLNSFKDVQKYVSISNHCPTIYAVLFSEEVWNTYPEDVQQALLKAVQTASEESFAMSDALDQDVLDQVKGEVEVNEIDMEAFETVAAELYTNPELVESIGQDLVDEALQAVGKK